MKHIKDKDQYLKDYPHCYKWLNECMICHTIGYKPNMPEKITPGAMAENLRKLFNELKVNDIEICPDCEKHWKG